MITASTLLFGMVRRWVSASPVKTVVFVFSMSLLVVEWWWLFEHGPSVVCVRGVECVGEEVAGELFFVGGEVGQYGFHDWV